MEGGYSFLERLGLDDSADARAIRRAYARELKQIDQAGDPQGFQVLRECYEAALGWAAWMADQQKITGHEQAAMEDGDAAAAAPDAAPEAARRADKGRVAAAPVSVPEPESEPGLSPAALGCLVFAEFRKRFPSPAQRSPDAAEAVWTDALAAALADERLLNLDARLIFELQLAQLLAGGWQPGHEALFPAAAKLLGWNHERRRLARLDMAGQVLDLALDERMGFYAQDIQARTRQRQVLVLLRGPAPCSDRRIMAEMAVVEQMLLRFPDWLPLIVPMAEVERWRARYWERKGHAAGPLDTQPGSLAMAARRWWIPLFMVLAMLLMFLFEAAGGDKDARREAGAAPARHEEQLSRRQLDEIASRIDYRPGPLARAGIQRASFVVFLDQQGRVARVERREQAADPAYTAAVEKAIRGSAPFPRWTARRLELHSEAELKARTPPKPGPDPLRQANAGTGPAAPL